MAGVKRKLSPGEKDQILQLLAQGYSVAQVAGQFGLDPRRIGGLLSTWRNRGMLPGLVGSAASWTTAPATPPPPSPSVPPPIESPPPVTDEWYTSPTVRYWVERTVPQDGALGALHGWTDPGDFAHRYGAGRYRIRVSEGGALIGIIIWVVDEQYGPPRLPPVDDSGPSDGWRPLPQEWS